MAETKLKSGLVLSEGENVVVESEAELWAESSNPIAHMLGTMSFCGTYASIFRMK